LYLSGALTGYQLTNDYKMLYDAETKMYRQILKLKQGYYNYRYVCVNDELTYIDCDFSAGNYYETENDYIIIVYNASVADDYDRVIGFSIRNSLE
jgi:hypothetical protein